jgi:hypothetical protein
MELFLSLGQSEFLQGTSPYIVFIDECGDHSLDKIDPDFPLFLLCGVVVERKKYVDEIIKPINSFKLKYWDHEGVNLHSRDIRKAEGAFSILRNAGRRQGFVDDLTKLIADIPFQLFIVGIDKNKHKAKYEKDAKNPYELALTYLFERILYFLELNKVEHLPVIVEARGKNEDRELEVAFYKLLSQGTFYNSAARFKKLSCKLLFENKKRNIAGIQLADLCAYPSARHVLKPGQVNRAYEVVKNHIFSDGKVSGWKTFP